MNDEDIYQAMIGGAPTTPERQAALAANLRQQSGLGMMLALSGDRVLAPFGQAMTKQAEGGAQQIAGERERERTAQMMEQYRASQEQHMTDQIRAMIQVQGMKGLTARDVAEIAAASRLGVADIKAGTAGQGKKLSQGMEKEIDTLGDSLDGVTQALNTFKPEYAGTGIPGGRGIANQLASMGVGTQNMKDAQNWWSFYNRNFSLTEIHRLFGARFTAPEKQRFDEAHANTSMDPNQITQKLASVQDMQRRAIARRLDAWEREGYDVSDQRAQHGITRDMSSPNPLDFAPRGGAGGGATAPPPAGPTGMGAATPPTGLGGTPAAAATAAPAAPASASRPSSNALKYLPQRQAPPTSALGPQPQSMSGATPSVLERALAAQQQGIPMPGNLYQGLA